MIRRPQALPALAAVLCAGFGAVLARQHPLAPAWALIAFVAAMALVAWRPRHWLWIVPAALPILDFAPWTGGLVIEEFDLLVLAVAAALQARAAWSADRSTEQPRRWTPFEWAALAFALLSVASLARGVAAAGGPSLAGAWFQGYEDPLNAWRVFKSVLWAALLWRPLRREFAVDRDSAVRRLVAGMLGGLLAVVLAAISERAAYTSLWQFSGPYRTTALFWEMHVGGGAIDAYLGLAVPFVAWTLWSQKSPGLWSVAATLALLAVYTCLTTFSRGVYVAVAVPLAVLGVVMLRRAGRGRRSGWVTAVGAAAALVAIDAVLILAFDWGGAAPAGLMLLALALSAAAWLRWKRPCSWRVAASTALAMALLLEVFAVIGLGTFLRERIAATDSDYLSRREHWSDGVSLMDTPADWLAGIGAGRLPEGYATRVPGLEFPGDVRWQPARFVRLLGPRTRDDIDGVMALNQRVAIHPGNRHQLDLDVRAATPAHLYVRVCESHLLYARHCQAGVLALRKPTAGWQHATMMVYGQAMSVGDPAWPRGAIFSIADIDVGGDVAVDHLVLTAPDGTPLLSNGDFSNGLAHWLPTAMGYYVPWHIDNLYLDVLVERGLPALLAFLACAAIALRRLAHAGPSGPVFAPFLAASLGGALCAGLVNSVMDVPRVAFLLFFVVIAGAELGAGVNARATP
ncbi:hypothetical protein [Scleromatobacter humisilvae]|uniref:Uncharacterized protein n=1 Tax=Scleromatobacter humisilvae TaxID=2897159 RepID=A0A9X1YJ35_9BURK|nr:hypothetical protein [Scleromatobacter humisilvae]MCK9686340.1 hypothetical protein [Scleromatobacter humisilvae]